MSLAGLVWRPGGCHCGAVRFEAALPDETDAQTCTCSICSMIGFIHLIVPDNRFRLLQGAECLAHYRFNTGVADHTFCIHCGVKSFYRPRSHPDGWSVNGRCLDEGVRPRLRVAEFDGRHWEANIGALAPLAADGPP